MPRNHDEPVEWPDEVEHSIEDLINLLELSEDNHSTEEEE